jgi:hypothetical protein
MGRALNDGCTPTRRRRIGPEKTGERVRVPGLLGSAGRGGARVVRPGAQGRHEGRVPTASDIVATRELAQWAAQQGRGFSKTTLIRCSSNGWTISRGAQVSNNLTRAMTTPQASACMVAGRQSCTTRTHRAKRKPSNRQRGGKRRGLRAGAKYLSSEQQQGLLVNCSKDDRGRWVGRLGGGAGGGGRREGKRRKSTDQDETVMP